MNLKERLIEAKKNLTRRRLEDKDLEMLVEFDERIEGFEKRLASLELLVDEIYMRKKAVK